MPWVYVGLGSVSIPYNLGSMFLLFFSALGLLNITITISLLFFLIAFLWGANSALKGKKTTWPGILMIISSTLWLYNLNANGQSISISVVLGPYLALLGGIFMLLAMLSSRNGYRRHEYYYR
jgi:SNF family Na+-dependent transporter